jgi:hypothetical protein
VNGGCQVLYRREIGTTILCPKKSCVELSVQLAVLLVIWRIKILQPTAMKNYVTLKCE